MIGGKMSAKNSSLLKSISFPRAFLWYAYIFGEDSRENPHDDGYTGLVKIWYLLVFDDMRRQDVDDEDDDEDKGLDMECLGCHVFKIL